MKLNKTTWAYKIYVFCYLITSKLFNKELVSFGENKPIPEHTNLCKLMRSAFIWTPVYFVVLGGLIYGIGYSLFILPMTYGGAVGYFNVYVVPALFIGFAVLAGWMVSLVFGDSEKRKAKQKAKFEAKEKLHAEGKYTFWELVVKYAKATKQKICPMIDVV